MIYARVSTQDQNVDQQAAYCKEWCKRNKHKVVWTIKDKESASISLMQRERFKKLINQEYNFDYDAVLVYNIDRLTRNWDDVTVIERFFRVNWAKTRLMSVSEPIELHNASGRMQFRLKMVINCYMPEDTLEKSRIGIDRAKKEGKYKGGKKGRTWTLSKKS